MREEGFAIYGLFVCLLSRHDRRRHEASDNMKVTSYGHNMNISHTVLSADSLILPRESICLVGDIGELK